MFDRDVLQCTVFICCLTTRSSDDVEEEQVRVYVLSYKITLFHFIYFLDFLLYNELIQHFQKRYDE